MYRNDFLSLAVIVWLIVTAVQVKSAQDDPAIEHGLRVLESLRHEQFDQVAAEFNARMSAALPAEELGPFWLTLKSQIGAFESVTDSSVTDVEGITVVTLECRFEGVALNVIIAFDGDDRIAGLRFVPSLMGNIRPSNPWPPIGSPKEQSPVRLGSGHYREPSVCRHRAPTFPLAAGCTDRDATIESRKGVSPVCPSGFGAGRLRARGCDLSSLDSVQVENEARRRFNVVKRTPRREHGCVRVRRFARKSERGCSGQKALPIQAEAYVFCDLSLKPHTVVKSEFGRTVDATQVAPEGVAGDRFCFVGGSVKRSADTNAEEGPDRAVFVGGGVVERVYCELVDLRSQLKVRRGRVRGDESGFVGFEAVDKLLSPVTRVGHVQPKSTAITLVEFEFLRDWRDRLRWPHFIRVAAVPGPTEKYVEFKVTRTL